MIKLVILLLLLILNLIFLFVLLVNGIRCIVGSIRHVDTLALLLLVKKNFVILLICILFLVLFVVMTQIMAKTPPLKDQDGKVIEGSIAELKQVSINGRKEWISVRGENKDAPVLLFLAGGPGGTIRH